MERNLPKKMDFRRVYDGLGLAPRRTAPLSASSVAPSLAPSWHERLRRRRGRRHDCCNVANKCGDLGVEMLIRRLTAKVSGPTSRVRQGALDAVAALLDTDVGSAYLMIPGGDRSTYRASKKAKYMEHLLRRTIFLFVPVTVCALLLVWGKVSHGFCASGVGPPSIWYFCQLLVVVYPLCVLCGSRNSDQNQSSGEIMPLRWSRGLIAALFVIACSLSCIEFVLNMLASRSTARATTITMHTMLALIVIPSMFRAHDLSKRSPAQPPISFAHDDARSIFAEKGGRSGVIAAKRRTQSDFRLARDGPHRPRVLSAGDAKRQSGDSSDTGDEREEQQPEDWGDTKIILANMWNTASENLNSAAAASLLFGSSTYRWARRMRSRMPNSDRDADADSLSSDDDYEAAEEARVSVNVGSSNSIVDLGHFFWVCLSYRYSFLLFRQDRGIRFLRVFA